MAILMRLGTTVIGAVSAISFFGTGAASAAPVPGSDADFISVTTTSNSATITATPKTLNSCNASLVLPGTPNDAVGPPAWSVTTAGELIAIDPALADTPRFRPVFNEYPQWFGTRTQTITLEPGSYVVLAECTPYNSSGGYDGDDTQYYKAFTVNGISTPEPEEPGGSGWGSLDSLLP
ncbi:hypothetical protein [Gordonia tangerina]|uniref:Secreted protein n=1 Tax=Gordonia tangerina TaxID=2911060 RepID=A0ABS9DLU4_9ACTN|nr:hypothetical protein [Gordonia tangerina]MCF3940204.1 hypothetical protein [Gordonia tangerina]